MHLVGVGMTAKPVVGLVQRHLRRARGDVGSGESGHA